MFIKLTSGGTRKPVWVNTDNIVSFKGGNGDSVEIQFVGSYLQSFTETTEQVEKLLASELPTALAKGGKR